jgi:hypothetical protein
MEASIRGKLIKPGSVAAGGFLFTPELWKWVYEWFPKFAGKQVEIAIREVGEG